MNGDLAARVAALAPAQRALLERALARQRRGGEAAEPSAPPARIPRRPAGGDLVPLSLDQERLWFIQQLDRLSPAYNIYGANRFRSRIEPALLARALDLLVARHEVLRTSFPAVDGRPMQRIAPRLAVGIPLVDLRGLPEERREDEAQRLAAATVRAPFDLDRLPLFRVRLLRVADDDFICPIAIHHIVTDWISYYAMESELTAIYMALRAGAEPALPPLSIQFADFAIWQRRRLADGSVLAEQLAYWRRHLEGAPELLTLPTDRPRQPVQTPWGARRRLRLLPATSEALRGLARRAEATLFVTVLAVWKAHLLRLSGQERLIVGTPMAYRQAPELAGVLGFFLNQLPLYTDLSGNPPFREALRRVKETALAAYANQDLPFARLVEALQPERDLSRTPYTQVVFLLLDPNQLDRPVGGELVVEGYWVDAQRTQFDMTFSLWDGGAAGLYGWLEYATDLFDATTIGRMREQLRTLLAGVLADPERGIWDLPLLPEAERHQLVAEWSGGALLPDAGLPGAALPARIAARAAAAPAATAVVAGSERLRYGELAGEVERLARALSRLDLPAESVVGVCLERTPRLVAALLGVLAAGHAYLPLDPSHPADRRRFMLEDAGAAALILESEADGEGEEQAAGWPGRRLSVGALLAGGDERDAPALAEPGPEALAYVIYTSGSTGRPKGVEVRRGALSQLLQAIGERPGITAADRLLAVTTVAFDIAGLEIFLPLLAGATVILADRATAADGAALLALAAAEGATILQATPATWRLLLAAGWEGGRGKDGGLAVWCGGEALPAELAAELGARSGAVWSLYGPTETTIWSAVERVSPELDAGAGPALAPRPGAGSARSSRTGTGPARSPQTGTGPVPLGRPIPGTRFHVLDPTLRPAPPGVAGELAIGGAGLARGYRRRPDLTAERFVPDPFGGAGERLYRTGDRVRVLPPGRFEFLGRLDHQVKLRGYRIELGEVERALEVHPAVRQAAVLLRGDRLVGYYVRREGGRDGVGELGAFLRGLLPEYMVPAAFVPLPSLPLTASGKLDRRALARTAPAPEGAAPAGRAPSGPLEELVAGVLGEVLGLSQLAADDDFFSLGGHSLSAFQAVARLRAALAVDLPVAALFSHPTPASLAAAVAAVIGTVIGTRGGAGAPALPPLAPARGRGATAPLSFAQRRLWFLDRLRPGGTAYNLAAAFRLPEGALPALLAAAVGEVVRRHEALRTTFVLPEETAAEPVQRIAPAAPGSPVPLPAVDLSALPEGVAEGELERLATAAIRRPFDLARGPLLRLLLLAGQGGERVLVGAIHHIVSDAWSLAILFGEVAAAYGALAAGKAPDLPALPLQYADYALWQRAALAGGRLKAEVDYWRRQLAGAPALLELPTDRPRPAVRGEAGASRPVLVPAPLAAALAALARRQGATLFMVLLAGFSALLARLSGQEDVVVGAPVAGRGERALEELIGFFVNTLALRTDLAGEPRFAELLGRVRAAALEAYLHAAVPFERLVEELAPERSLGHTPLFQVALTWQNVPAPRHTGAEALAFAPVELASWSAKFDLTLELAESPDGLAGRLEHSAELWDGTSAARLAASWATLLEAAADDPFLSWRELPLLGAGERHQLLREWGGPAAPVAPAPGAPPLHRSFEAWARARPEAPAVLFRGAWLTYGELNARANRLARLLRALGAGPEAVVALLLAPSHALVVALLAVAKAGAAYLPLDPEAPAERIGFQLGDAGAGILVTDGAGTVAPERPLRRVDLAAEAAEIDALAALDLLAGPEPDGLAYVIYTSGSTGRPKGTEVSHRNQARLFAAARPALGFDERDTWLLAHSYAFDFSVWELWGALAHGGRLVVAPAADRRSPAAIAKLLAAAEVTILNQTPSAFYQLAAYGESAGRRPGPALRRVIFGGESLDPSRLAAWLTEPDGGAPLLVNMYGITETTVHVTWKPLGPADARRGGSPIGRPLPDLALHLLDDRMEPVPPLAPGEIFVGGAGVARGYRRRPELTAWRFVPDPFAAVSGKAGGRLYRSGDLGRRRPDGEVEHLGRTDQQVKIRGFRIEPAEVEAALLAQPEVGQAAVLARREPEGEARLVAYLVAAEEAAVPGADALRDRLRASLPDYMLPAAFVLLAELPRTANGKLDRAALPAPGAARPALERPYSAPEGFAEEALAAVWARVLGLDAVGRDDNFFSLGGDSIRSLQVMALARERGIRFELEQIFRHQTVAELAKAAAAAGAEEAAGRPFSLLAAADRAALPADVVDAYPLTMLQAGMLYHLEATPDYPLYHNVDSLEIQARLVPGAFQEALDWVVSRHPVLRTGFDLTSYSEPLQLVHAAAALPLAIVDLTRLGADEQRRRLAAFVQAEKRRRFDLARPTLLRLHAHLLDGERCQLTLTECHAILDGWSLNSTLAEIFGRYLAVVHGQPPPSEPPPRASFRDYVALERQALADPAQREFWRAKLAGIAPTALAPRFVSRPDGGAPASVVVTILPDDVSSGLLRLAAGAALPLKSACLAAHLRVLELASGAAPVVSGMVINGRPETPDGDRVRGLFLNTVPLVLERAAGATWTDLARAAFAAEAELLPFRRYPLAALQREQGWGAPLQAAFNYTRFHVWKGVLDGEWQVASGGGFSVELEENHFPLMVNFNYVDRSDRLRVTLDTQMDAAAAGVLLGYYLGVLTAMSADPAARVEDTVPLPEAERQAVLREWSGAPDPEGELATLPALFAAAARRRPLAPALLWGEETLTYGELDRLSGGLARRLRRLGVGPEIRVGVALERSPALVLFILAVLRAGGAYVPLDPALPEERLAFLLADSGVALVLAGSAERERLGSLAPGALVLDGLAGWPAPDPASEPDAPPLPAPDPAHLAYLLYTSGSTGRPKGVGVEHRSVAALAAWARETFSAAELDGVLAATAIGFDLSVFEILVPLALGGRVVLAPSVLDLPRLPAVEEVRLVNTVPSAMVELAAAGLPPGVLTVNLAGEPLRGALARQVYAASRAGRVLNLYGPTEDTVYSTAFAVGRDDVGEPAIGRPLPGGRAWVLGAGLSPLPGGVPGELCLAGAGLARGYLGRADLTAAAFVPDPFAAQRGEPGARLYRTGDRARHRPDGNLEHLGRLDQQVKIRGHRVEPGEVEARLDRHPAVRRSAVVARVAGAGDRRLVAYLVPAGEAAPEAAELLAFLARELPAPMLPAAFVWLPALPLTRNGKLDRSALPDPAAASPAAGPYVAPRGPLEERLAAIFAEVLGVAQVGAEDGFFTLGGHSLLATRALGRIRSAFGCELAIADLFAAPTVAALAGRIASRRAEGRAPAGSSARPDARPSTGPSTGSTWPLSPAQLRLWFLWQLEPGSAVYNMPLAVRLTGDLHLPALAGALTALARRHAVLRTTFAVDAGGEPVQRVASPMPLPPIIPPLVDLSTLPGALGEGEAARLVAMEARLPFDLTRGPLFRPALLRLAAAAHVVTATMHHIISDGWSREIFVREMVALYAAASAGRPAALPALPLQYGEYAARQRALLDEPAMAVQLAYWRQRLAGAPAVLALPTAEPRPPVASARGASHRLLLPAPLTAAAAAFGRRHGATPFMTLLAALAALCARYTGQTDLVLGAPIAGRHRGGTEGLIGLFLNSLALRCDLAGDPGFAELVGRARDSTLQAFTNQDVPFERLLEELRPPRDLSRTPLFQVVLNWQSFGAPGGGDLGGGPGLALEAFATGEPFAKFDLELYAEEERGSFTLEFVYCRDLFAAAEIEEMARHLARLLTAAVEEPARPLSTIDLGGAPPSVALSAPAADHFPLAALDGSLADRFELQAALHPGRIAVRTDSEAWTYARLAATAAAIAHALLDRGGPAGERIAILLSPGPWQAAAVLGVLAAGKAYLPLDLASPAERLLAILDDAAAEVVLVEGEADPATADLAAALAGRGLSLLDVSGLPPAPAGWARPPVPPEALAYLLYTSGTTGRPKGVMQSHRNVLAHLRAYTHLLGLAPGDRLSMLPALAFDAAVMDLFGALLNGAELCPWDIKKEGVEGLGAFLLRRGVTVWHSTPTVYRAFLAAEGEGDGERFPDLRLVVLGGEEATRRDLELFRRRFAPDCRLANGLGPSESTLALHGLLDPGDPSARPGLPVGRPVLGVEVALEHAAGEQPATWGTGEIVVRSPYVALGYWRAPEQTAAAFVPDPRRPGGRRYRTGDLGRRLPGGGIEFAGRRDLQVKIRGVRVEPAEIEALLAAHPAVAQAAVVSWEVRPVEPRLAAYVVARPGGADGEALAEELRERLRARLPMAMVPGLVAVVEALPVGPTGKVDRRALAELAARAERPAADGHAAPETPTEQALAAIWSELLGLERISRHDSFFDLGGHSLLITRVRSRLQASLGVDLPLPELFAAPTLAAAAAAADRIAAAAAAADHAGRSPAPSGPRITAVRREAHRVRRDALDREP